MVGRTSERRVGGEPSANLLQKTFLSAPQDGRSQRVNPASYNAQQDQVADLAEQITDVLRPRIIKVVAELLNGPDEGELSQRQRARVDRAVASWLRKEEGPRWSATLVPPARYALHLEVGPAQTIQIRSCSSGMNKATRNAIAVS